MVTNKYLTLLAGLGMMGLDMNPYTTSRGERTSLKERSYEDTIQRNERVDRKIHKDNGLKEFDYNGGSVFAISQKVADKKANKRGWM